MTYDKEKLKNAFLQVYDGEPVFEPEKGWVHWMVKQGFGGMLADCVEEKSSLWNILPEDVPDDFKKTHVFRHLKVIRMHGGCVMTVVSKGKVIYDSRSGSAYLPDGENIVKIVRWMKHPKPGEEYRICVCRDLEGKLCGLSVCSHEDNYSKKTARLVAMENGLGL